MIFSLNTRLLIIVASGLLFFYLWPLLSDPLHQPLSIFDTLDGKLIQYKLLAESNLLFADSHTVIPNMMNGLPRLSYGTEYNYLVWLFALFDPLEAYVINEVLMHYTAFFSMFFLLQGIVIPQNVSHRLLIAATMALLFALTPFWFGSGLSISLLPIVLYALIRIYSRQEEILHWLILIIIPFFSQFIIIDFFFLLLCALWWCYDAFVHRKANLPLFTAILLMTAVSLLIEYRVLQALFFDSDFISHRTGFIKPYYDLDTAWLHAKRLFFHGAPHMNYSITPYTIGLLLITMTLSLFKDRLTNTRSLMVITVSIIFLSSDIWHSLMLHDALLPGILLFSAAAGLQKTNRHLALMLKLQLFFAFWYAFWFYEGIRPLMSHLPFLETFNMSRFYFLAVPLWIIMFVRASIMLIQKISYALPVILLVSIIQANAFLELRTFGNTGLSERASFQEYFAKDFFQLIAEKLEKSQNTYRIVSLCIDPAVTLYNGFYTLDGYSTNYPLHYKQTFRKIIEAKIGQDSSVRKLYDDWGSKCYFFAGNCGFDRYFPGQTLSQFDANLSAMYAMGGRYILSGYLIDESLTSGLKYLGTFQDKTSRWEVSVYEIFRKENDEIF